MPHKIIATVVIILSLLTMGCGTIAFLKCGDRGTDGNHCWGDKQCDCGVWVHPQYDCDEACIGRKK